MNRGQVGGVAAAVVTLWAVAATQVNAQTRHHCRDEAGHTFVLSRPCPSGTRTTAVSAGPAAPQYSPSPTARSATAQVRLPPETPEYHRYLSARCRSLDDTLRGGYAPNIRADVVEGMRREYARDCKDEERSAYSKLSSERREREQQRRDEEKTAQLAADASREQQARQAQQCAESRRIIANKRARTDLTDGEKNDLQRFEQVFRERCKR
jgi:hypothetical protein